MNLNPQNDPGDLFVAYILHFVCNFCCLNEKKIEYLQSITVQTSPRKNNTVVNYFRFNCKLFLYDLK